MARAFAPPEAGGLWAQHELGAMLKHQLLVDLWWELGQDRVLGPLVREPLMRCPAIVTFGDLLAHPHPPIELLEAVKVYAKGSARDADRPLPAPIATVLYYLVIIAAQRRCGRRITGLTEAELAAGVEWALAQEWLGEGPRKLLQQALPAARH